MIKSLFHYGFFRHIFLGKRNLHRAVCTGKRNITWLSEWSSFSCFLANICYMFADILCSMHLEFKYKSQHKEGDAILFLEETLTVCWINYIFGNHLIWLRCPGYIGTLYFWPTTWKKKWMFTDFIIPFCIKMSEAITLGSIQVQEKKSIPFIIINRSHEWQSQ